MKAANEWAYARAAQLRDEFSAALPANFPRNGETDTLGAFARYIEQHEKPPRDLDREEQIAEAVRKYHVARGCCDGTFAEPCPWKATQAEQRAKTDDREQERRDAEAFAAARLEDKAELNRQYGRLGE